MTERDAVVDLATALARADDTEPHELEYQIHDYVDTTAIKRLVEMESTDWRLTVTIADHEVTVDGSGRIRVDGDVQQVIER